MSKTLEPIGVGAPPIAIRGESNIKDIVDVFKAVPPSPPRYDPEVVKYFSLLKDYGVSSLELSYDGASNKVSIRIRTIDGDEVVLSGTPFSGSVIYTDARGITKSAFNYSPDATIGLPSMLAMIAISLMTAYYAEVTGIRLGSSPEPVGSVDMLGVLKPFNVIADRISKKLGRILIYLAKQS